MSAASDSAKLIAAAERAGLTVRLLKHGGYGIFADDNAPRPLTRIPKGRAAYHSVQRVRRDLARHGIAL